MTVPDELTSRIRDEFVEMPGLRLTFAQACRLWQLDATTCSATLDELLAERFLYRTPDGSYVAFPSARATPAATAISARRRATLLERAEGRRLRRD